MTLITLAGQPLRKSIFINKSEPKAKTLIEITRKNPYKLGMDVLSECSYISYISERHTFFSLGIQ